MTNKILLQKETAMKSGGDETKGITPSPRPKPPVLKPSSKPEPSSKTEKK